MPFQPTTPEIKAIPIPEEVQENAYHIRELHIYVDPNDSYATRVAVYWTKGHKDTEGVYHEEADSLSYTELQGVALLTKMAEAVNGISRYDAAKEGVWELLQSVESLPDGSIV